MKSEVKEKFQEVVNVNRKGYTILELIIVIVIAGIMAAVAIPKIGNVSKVDVYTAARIIKSDIRYAQQRAMSKFKTTTITFDANQDTYHITDTGGASIDKSLPSSSGAQFDATYTIVFDSTGAPDAANTVVIRSGDQAESILVSGATGKASIIP